MLYDPTGTIGAITVLGLWKALWTGPNDQEFILLNADPDAALTVLLLAGVAKAKTISLFGHADDDTQANAFQHAYWSALVTTALGIDAAAAWTAAHEGLYANDYNDLEFDTDGNGRVIRLYNPNGWQNSTRMDMHNNAVGMTFANMININAKSILGVLLFTLGSAIVANMDDALLWALDAGLLVALK